MIKVDDLHQCSFPSGAIASIFLKTADSAALGALIGPVFCWMYRSSSVGVRKRVLPKVSHSLFMAENSFVQAS